ncbi:MAG TPA: DoxX family protein [Candidatus Corynebacterium avicola]|uniref:DoxX family protein n=1 Tax=Candidatus Corynebacterium avicola TaxID=2838527 RepID=A0A9D1UNA7_9CORY|nr:DoxX family protein [Candidatus Corynebacterium avicola]
MSSASTVSTVSTSPSGFTGVVRDVVILIARVAVGVILFAHGWQKFFTNGIDGTSQGFEGMGVPAPTAAAIFAASVELVGGALLIIGLLTPLVAVLVTANLAGAYWYAHSDAGTIFVDAGGYELVLALAAGALLVGAVAGGRISLDHLVFGRKKASSPAA